MQIGANIQKPVKKYSNIIEERTYEDVINDITILGDLNGRVGKKEFTTGAVIGKHGEETRNPKWIQNNRFFYVERFTCNEHILST